MVIYKLADKLIFFRSHAEAIGSVVAEIQENAGNPERIRMSLAQVDN